MEEGGETLAQYLPQKPANRTKALVRKIRHFSYLLGSSAKRKGGGGGKEVHSLTILPTYDEDGNLKSKGSFESKGSLSLLRKPKKEEENLTLEFEISDREKQKKQIRDYGRVEGKREGGEGEGKGRVKEVEIEDEDENKRRNSPSRDLNASLSSSSLKEQLLTWTASKRKKVWDLEKKKREEEEKKQKEEGEEGEKKEKEKEKPQRTKESDWIPPPIPAESDSEDEKVPAATIPPHRREEVAGSIQLRRSRSFKKLLTNPANNNTSMTMSTASTTTTTMNTSTATSSPPQRRKATPRTRGIVIRGDLPEGQLKEEDSKKEEEEDKEYLQKKRRRNTFTGPIGPIDQGVKEGEKEEKEATDLKEEDEACWAERRWNHVRSVVRKLERKYNGEDITPTSEYGTYSASPSPSLSESSTIDSKPSPLQFNDELPAKPPKLKSSADRKTLTRPKPFRLVESPVKLHTTPLSYKNTSPPQGPGSIKYKTNRLIPYANLK